MLGFRMVQKRSTKLLISFFLSEISYIKNSLVSVFLTVQVKTFGNTSMS